jgi:1-phosphofructokinase family hexose kinase
VITVAGFNTAIDRLVTLDVLEPGSVQRASAVASYPGGKGVHVAQTIAALGEAVQLVGLVDTTHRNFITRRMSERGVLFHGVEIKDDLRQCLALRERDGRMTEVLDPGPMLAAAARDQLLRTLDRCLDNSEALVLTGSLPRGFGSDTYARIARQASGAGVVCLVDASGDVLRQVVDAQPCVIKPNRDEASGLAGRPVQTLGDAVEVARSLHARGIALPVVTLGAEGAVAFDGRVAWHASIVLDHSANAVGSGDCFLAGLAVALKRAKPLEEALRLGVACGVANAMDEETGYARRNCVELLLEKVWVRSLAD